MSEGGSRYPRGPDEGTARMLARHLSGSGAFPYVAEELGLSTLGDDKQTVVAETGESDTSDVTRQPSKPETNFDATYPDFSIVRLHAGPDHYLTVFGMDNHTYNPGGGAFYLLQQALNEWEQATERVPQARVILNEGGTRGPFPEDMPWETVLAQAGEQGFMAHYARKHGILLDTAEPPSYADLLQAALEIPAEGRILPARLVGAYAVMRQTRQCNVGGSKPLTNEDAPAFVTALLRRTAMKIGAAAVARNCISPFAGYDCSFESFANDYQDLRGQPFDIRDWEDNWNEAVEHMYEIGGSPIMRVSQIVNRVRDESFVRAVRMYFEAGGSPLYVTHKYHVDRIRQQLLAAADGDEVRCVSSILDQCQDSTVSARLRQTGVDTEWGEQYRQSPYGAAYDVGKLVS